KYDLSQNYPNPFNPVTTINYDQLRDGLIIIIIYDITGREVKTLLNEIKPAGYYKIQFNAADLSSGAYFYRMTAGDFVATKKMVVIK
ncbi:MAG: T9SS type A sorting domain-containing protein, partial [Ignavibacteria bacterium]